jgi:hypothetical protein
VEGYFSKERAMPEQTNTTVVTTSNLKASHPSVSKAIISFVLPLLPGVVGSILSQASLNSTELKVLIQVRDSLVAADLDSKVKQ